LSRETGPRPRIYPRDGNGDKQRDKVQRGGVKRNCLPIGVGPKGQKVGNLMVSFTEVGQVKKSMLNGKKGK